MSVRAKTRAIRRALKRNELLEYAELRIKWIDRLTNSIDAHPGCPSSSEVAKAAQHLRQVLLTYREGFIHALNLTGARRR